MALGAQAASTGGAPASGATTTAALLVPVRMLAKLRGIGPATVSAVLAAVYPERYPFLEDVVAAQVPELGPPAFTPRYYAAYAAVLRARAAELAARCPDSEWTPARGGPGALGDPAGALIFPSTLVAILSGTGTGSQPMAKLRGTAGDGGGLDGAGARRMGRRRGASCSSGSVCGWGRSSPSRGWASAGRYDGTPTAHDPADPPAGANWSNASEPPREAARTSHSLVGGIVSPAGMQLLTAVTRRLVKRASVGGRGDWSSRTPRDPRR